MFLDTCHLSNRCVGVLTPFPGVAKHCRSCSCTYLFLLCSWTLLHVFVEDVPLKEFMYMAFTRMPRDSYCSWFQVPAVVSWRAPSAINSFSLLILHRCSGPHPVLDYSFFVPVFQTTSHIFSRGVYMYLPLCQHLRPPLRCQFPGGEQHFEPLKQTKRMHRKDNLKHTVVSYWQTKRMRRKGNLKHTVVSYWQTKRKRP